MQHEFNQFHDLKIEYHYFAVLFKFLCTSTQNEYRSLTTNLLNRMCVKTHAEAEKYLMQFKNSMFLDEMAAENSVFGAYYLASILKRRDDDDITVDPEQVANTIISNRIDNLLRFINFNLNKDNANFDYQYFITPQKQHDLYNFAYGQMQKYIAKAVQNYTSENKIKMRTHDIAEQVLSKEDVDTYYNDNLKTEFNKLHKIKVSEAHEKNFIFNKFLIPLFSLTKQNKFSHYELVLAYYQIFALLHILGQHKSSKILSDMFEYLTSQSLTTIAYVYIPE